MNPRRNAMKGRQYRMTVPMLAAAGLMCGLGLPAHADALVTHRIPAALASEAAAEAGAFCAKSNYRETAGGGAPSGRAARPAPSSTKPAPAPASTRFATA